MTRDTFKAKGTPPPAAEGVQAGEVSVEVKIRARELLAQAFEANAQYVQAAFVRKGCGGIAPEKVAIAAIVAAQQPEARGVVDCVSVAAIVADMRNQANHLAGSGGCEDAWAHHLRKFADRLATLTGERNG